MAETASPVTLALGVAQLIELSAVADTLKRFDPPANARVIRIVPHAVDLKLVIGGTDAAALGTTAYEPLFAKTSNPVPVPGTNGGKTRNLDTAVVPNSRRVCVAGPASAIFTITAFASLEDEANTANADADFAAAVLAADAMAKPTTTSVLSWLVGYNGTTGDLIRSGLVAVQTSFVGLLNTISMGRYNATPPTLADGNVAPTQQDARGNTKVAINDGANQVAVNTAAADGAALGVNRLSTLAALLGHNGTTLDLLRTAIVAATSTFTGLLNTLPLGRYNATPPSPTDGQVLPEQLDSRGNVKVAINDGANQVAVNTTAADGEALAIKRLSAISVLLGYGGATLAMLRAGITAPTATLTGWLNTLPWAIFNATPTVRTEGQGGPFQADASGNLRSAIAEGANIVAVSTVGADAVSNTRNEIAAGARLSGYNGTTWERLRTAVIVPTGTLAGWLNILPWAVYNAAPITRTEGQGGTLQAEPLGSLLVHGSWVAGGTLADGSAAYQLVTLTSGSGLLAVPDRGALGLLEIRITGDATPVTATVKLTRDSAGDQPFAGPVTVALEVGQTTATSKAAGLDLQRMPYSRGGDGTSGSLYAWVKFDAVGAGPTAVAMRLHGEYR